MLSRGNRRGLLVWDSASTHRTLPMKTFLLEQRIDQAMIPSGCTCHLQSFDLVISKPFKDAIRKEILKYIEIGLSRNQIGNLIKQFKGIFCEWIRSSWNSITECTVNNALT